MICIHHRGWGISSMLAQWLDRFVGRCLLLYPSRTSSTLLARPRLTSFRLSLRLSPSTSCHRALRHLAVLHKNWYNTRFCKKKKKKKKKKKHKSSLSPLLRSSGSSAHSILRHGNPRRNWRAFRRFARLAGRGDWQSFSKPGSTPKQFPFPGWMDCYEGWKGGGEELVVYPKASPSRKEKKNNDGVERKRLNDRCGLV